MRLHRFHVDSIESAGSSELSNQILNVFRLRTGDRVVLFDGSGQDCECEIESEDPLKFKVLSSKPSRFMPKHRLYLYAAIVKKDNFEFIVEKATELGVTDIIPVVAERTEKKALNEERLKKIAVEASEQSGRGDVPRIHAIQNLNDAVLSAADIRSVAFHTEGELLSKENSTKSGDSAIFIGPEGGWTEREIEMFHTNKMAVACLGPQVLRAETAVVAALSHVVFGA